MSTRRGFRRGGSKRSRPMRGYKSKTQVIAHNEARNVVKRALSSTLEKKQFDGQQVYTNAPTTGVIKSLFSDPNSSTGIGEGTDAVQTIGDMIKPTKLVVRYAINTNGTPANALCRVVIFQTRGSGVPSMADIFTSNVDYVLSGYDVGTVGTPGGRGDIRILYDHVTSVNTTGDAVKYRTVRISGKRLRHCRFFAGSPDAFNDGNIYILYVSDNSVSPARIKYYSAIDYIDA